MVNNFNWRGDGECAWLLLAMRPGWRCRQIGISFCLVPALVFLLELPVIKFENPYFEWVKSNLILTLELPLVLGQGIFIRRFCCACPM